MSRIPEQTHIPARSGYIFAFLATIIWSGNFIVARGLADEFSPVLLAFFRWLTASVVLLPFGLPGLIREWKEVRANLGHLIPSAFLGVTIFNTLIYIAGKHTTAMNLSLIAVFSPVFIILLARIVLNDPITLRRLTGLTLAIIGVIVLTTKGNLSLLATLRLNIGDLWMLLATAIFAAYSILVRRKPRHISPTTYLTATFFFGLLMLIPWAAWDWAANPPVMPSGHVIGSILFIGIGPALICYLFWNKAIASIGPVKAGMVYYSLPLFSGLEAWLLLGEKITWIHALAGLLIIAGISVATTKK
jgi:drug/metabolite transporter (DMT)-like permease